MVLTKTTLFTLLCKLSTAGVSKNKAVNSACPVDLGSFNKGSQFLGNIKFSNSKSKREFEKNMN